MSDPAPQRRLAGPIGQEKQAVPAKQRAAPLKRAKLVERADTANPSDDLVGARCCWAWGLKNIWSERYTPASSVPNAGGHGTVNCLQPENRVF